jgi:hypothetical protein
MAMAPAPPTASPMPPDGSATMDAGGAMDGTESVVVTICKEADGSYMVYPGDEPDDSGSTAGGADDMSEDDADAMGPAGAAPGGGDMGGGAAGAGGMVGGGSGGKAADSIGAALKAAMDILQSDQSGGSGSANDQFAAGFNGDKAPTPVGMGGAAGLKYPPS